MERFLLFYAISHFRVPSTCRVNNVGSQIVEALCQAFTNNSSHSLSIHLIPSTILASEATGGYVRPPPRVLWDLQGRCTSRWWYCLHLQDIWKSHSKPSAPLFSTLHLHTTAAAHAHTRSVSVLRFLVVHHANPVCSWRSQQKWCSAGLESSCWGGFREIKWSLPDPLKFLHPSKMHQGQ